ncbi:hydrolase [Aneurinibacillus sp. Ricciae_BoGa-3]|uniref:hydrolase n=1 Tax=Aneurinibacillus sp. Ricciae_BoGa-3 TaxID=3022697 RepID=UPI00234218A9|nr:hydrolase [Aneurinibacillus sp. Ricciae_BoGa-3]WCK55057.1 hydrolase [Aneurinibacillus sp. Ricciae_BoGa-3]
MEINLNKTALVIIDLQKGIVGMQTAPHSGSLVVENAAKIAQAFASKGAFVVAVNVDFGQVPLRPIIDQAPRSTHPPQNWAEIVPEINKFKSVLITKRQWGAFYGTELDLQLRRRGVDTIILCGISTSIGVDTTAREAFQLGYQQIFIEDAMTASSLEEHRYSIEYIFPRIGRIRKTEDIMKAIMG